MFQMKIFDHLERKKRYSVKNMVLIWFILFTELNKFYMAQQKSMVSHHLNLKTFLSIHIDFF